MDRNSPTNHLIIMSRSSSPLPPSLRHMMVQEVSPAFPPASRAGRRQGCRSPHRVNRARGEQYKDMMPNVNEPRRHYVDKHGIPARSSISLVNLIHPSSPTRSNAPFANARPSAAHFHGPPPTAHLHGPLPTANHHAPPTRSYYPLHASYPDHRDATYHPRTAPLPTRAISPHHPYHPDILRRHSDQPHHPQIAPPGMILRPETSYESVSHGSKPGFIHRATSACDLCKKTKTRCSAGEPLVEGGEPTACAKCLRAGEKCVRTGKQRKRGPLPGSTRPVSAMVTGFATGAGAGTGAGQAPADRKRKTSSAQRTTPPRPSSALPPLATLAILPPPPAMTRVPSTHAPTQEHERESTSARSSITSIHILTPEDDRRDSYEFSATDHPQYPPYPKSRPQSQSQSAPLHASSSSSWPRHSEPHHRYQQDHHAAPSRRPSSNHVRGDILSWPSGQPATELDVDMEIDPREEAHYRRGSFTSPRDPQYQSHSSFQTQSRTQYGKPSPPILPSGPSLFHSNYTVGFGPESEARRPQLALPTRTHESPLPSIQHLGLDVLTPPPSSRIDRSSFGHTGRTLPAILPVRTTFRRQGR